MKKPLVIPVLAAALFAPACNDQSASAPYLAGALPGLASASPLDAYYVAEAPAGVRQISEVLAEVVPGKEVVLAGEIMGRLRPFVEGRAMVTLGDPTKITPCNRIPGDSCPTPWDNCCTDPDLLKKSIATIQFVDSEGKVIKCGIKGYRKIKELSYLTVKGTIAEGSNPENLLVTVSAFHFTEPSPYVNAPPTGETAHTVKSGPPVIEKDGDLIFTAEPEKKNE